ncbi:hypothetical protein B0H15DRAFT_953250 [Mycena belliarum]|uniref:Uncharacterized protein n=1 Tax=Mycena belliarum TaxID=1033014 RepID=A0AAD6XIC7_9AGAR|nr:hypothetical protein B0H15DRAFT_953250 [Mycena belliae]
MGIPLVHHVNKDPNRAVTAVFSHTLDSLMQYEEGEKVKALIPRLMTLTWGVEKTDTDPGVPGIFELEGMQRNLRSKHNKCQGSPRSGSRSGSGSGLHSGPRPRLRSDIRPSPRSLCRSPCRSLRPRSPAPATPPELWFWIPPGL